MARDCIAHSSFIATVCSVAYDILTTHNKECALQGGSEGVDGALVFHSTTSPHLDGSHITIVSFPGIKCTCCSWSNMQGARDCTTHSHFVITVCNVA